MKKKTDWAKMSRLQLIRRLQRAERQVAHGLKVGNSLRLTCDERRIRLEEVNSELKTSRNEVVGIRADYETLHYQTTLLETKVSKIDTYNQELREQRETLAIQVAGLKHELDEKTRLLVNSSKHADGDAEATSALRLAYDTALESLTSSRERISEVCRERDADRKIFDLSMIQMRRVRDDLGVALLARGLSRKIRDELVGIAMRTVDIPTGKEPF